jgi:hypothetical protein
MYCRIILVEIFTFHLYTGIISKWDSVQFEILPVILDFDPNK